MAQLLSLGREPSFAVSYERAVGLDRISSFSSRRNAKENARAVETATVIGKSFAKVARDVHGQDLHLPPQPQASHGLGLGGGEAQGEALRHGLGWFGNELHQALLKCPCFGRVTMLDDTSCVFDYSETTKRHELLQTRFDRQEHRHWLTDIRQRRLDSPAVELPRDQQKIVAVFPADVRRYLTVITGTLVQMEANDAETVRHDHMVGRAVKAAGRGLRKYGPGAAAGVGTGAAAAGLVTVGVWAIGSAIAAATAATAAPVVAVAGTAAAVAVADPAICWGDIVLTGYVG